LAANAVNFWLASSLIGECSHWTTKALANLDGAGDDEQEMVLRAGLGRSLMFSDGLTPATHANLQRAFSIAESRGSTEYWKRTVYFLWLYNFLSGALRESLRLGQRYAEFARSNADTPATNIANLMVGMSLTYLGKYVEATGLLEQAVRDYPITRRYPDMEWLGVDPPASAALGHLSICLFTRGLIDSAIQAAEQSIEMAQHAGKPVALCLELGRTTGLLFPEVGAFDRAEHLIATMLEQADRYGLDAFRALADCAKGRVLSMRGEPAAGAAALRRGLAQMEEANYTLFHAIFRGYFGEALAAAGHIDEGLAEAEAAMRFAEQMEYSRFLPELLRIHGSLIAKRNPDDHPAPEHLFMRAIDLAHRQQALYWELCAAVSLAELWQSRGRRAQAHALLAPICQRFTESFAAPVLVRANALLRPTEGGN
jgi:non-specific serine/threonine protein kinase